jgi:heavy metal sensor kinase
MTIRTRLTLWYSALLATVIIVFGVSLFSLLNWAWHAQLQENMRFVAQQMLEVISVDPATGYLRPPPLQAQFARMPYFAFGVQVWRADGTLIAHSENVSQFLEPFDPDQLSGLQATTTDMYLPDGTHALVSTVPIWWGPDTRRIGTLQIMSPLTTLEAATDRLVRVMIGVGVVALVLSFMVGSVIAGQALQPIEAISSAAKQITAAEDLSRRVIYDGPPDELGQLTQTFNTTLDRLERLFVAQRRFVADVSHELRTPLTTIQGNLDLIKRVGPAPELLEAIESEGKRMTRLVGDLLLLAQADSGRLPLIEEPVELGTLALEVFRQARVLAGEVQLKLGAIDAVRVMGDSDRLKQLMLNLITNAIKYTPAGGSVAISVSHEAGYALLQVSDTGIGIPKEDLPLIFDRFYRVDKARDRQKGGAGLGLSIARWIAEAHRGRIWAESEPGQGTTFYVQLPSIDIVETPPSLRETRPRMPAILRRQRGLGDSGQGAQHPGMVTNTTPAKRDPPA